MPAHQLPGSLDGVSRSPKADGLDPGVYHGTFGIRIFRYPGVPLCCALSVRLPARLAAAFASGRERGRVPYSWLTYASCKPVAR